jgi:hypothetical protein
MKVEKFDLEKVIHGAKVVTRDGREVLELTKFENLGELPLVGVVDGDLETWNIKGQYSETGPCNMDLFLESKVQSVWVNVYKDANGDLWVGSEYFATFESAQNYATNQRSQKAKECYLKTIEITDEV